MIPTGRKANHMNGPAIRYAWLAKSARNDKPVSDSVRSTVCAKRKRHYQVFVLVLHLDLAAAAAIAATCHRLQLKLLAYGDWLTQRY